MNGASAANATWGRARAPKVREPRPRGAAIERPRDTGSASEKSAPLPDCTSGLPRPRSAANIVRGPRSSAGTIATEIAVKRPHDLERLFEFRCRSLLPSSRSGLPRERTPAQSRSSPRCRRRTRAAAPGRGETPAGVEQGVVPDHVSPPRTLLRERFPSTSPVRVDGTG